MTLSARLLFACAAHALACAADPGPAAGAPAVRADVAAPLAGAADRGRDPSVVALGAGGADCTGVLVAPDVVLTSPACVAAPPSSLDVWTGEDLTHAELVGHGFRVLVPGDGCASLAAVLLDGDVPGIHTSSIRQHGPATGERVRAVGFASRAGETARVLRDHVPVLGATGDAFSVDEAPCLGVGHAAIDEDTGEIVGVGGAPASCGAEDRPTYARTDACLDFLAAALARSGEAARVRAAEAKDAGVPDASKPRRLPKSDKPAKDFGAACDKGADCAAGVCVLERRGRYCSRSCDVSDRCPTGFHCGVVGSAQKACLRVD